jgi:hypothetical protein
MPFIANVMVVGEGRRFLNCLITLKEDPPGSGKLESNSRGYLKGKGCEALTIE